ncbi:putative CZB domain-containing protein [Azospirillaceae bacterium]
MKVKVTFDINKARLVHLDWVIRVEKILDQNTESAPIALQHYQDCELGVWLHGAGRSKYRQYEDILRLAVEHRRFHHAVDHMLLALHEGNLIKTRELLIGVRHMSKDIIYLLTLLELKTVEDMRLNQFGGGFLATIESWFSSNVNWLEPPNTKEASPSVDITYARLAHLSWASRLDHRFRNYGKGVALQAHDSCDFGAWIQSVGLKKYADLDEIPLLETVHKGFHEAAARIIKHLQNRHLQRAEEAYIDVQNLSREIAWLLTLVEYRLKPQDEPKRTIKKEQSEPQTQSLPSLPAAEKHPQNETPPAPFVQLSPIMAVAEHIMDH